MGDYDLGSAVRRLNRLVANLCCKIKCCLGIDATTGDNSLVLSQTGEWVENGGSSPLKLYSENFVSGTQTASGDNSIAMGGTGATSLGEVSMSWGEGALASGYASTAWGSVGSASGLASTAWGNSTASGDLSTSFGNSTNAFGNVSTVWGYANGAQSYAETCFGIHSTEYIPVSLTTFQGTDRLLNVGNGFYLGSDADAFTILKNGKTGIGFDNFETTTKTEVLQVNGSVSAIIPSFDNDAAAGVGGLTTGSFYQTTGAAAAPLNIAGILMVKQ